MVPSDNNKTLSFDFECLVYYYQTQNRTDYLPTANGKYCFEFIQVIVWSAKTILSH